MSGNVSNGMVNASVSLEDFHEKVRQSSKLDGDVKLVGGREAGTWTLAKVNYGSGFARKVLGGTRTEVTSKEQNKYVREAFMRAIAKQYGVYSNQYRTALGLLQHTSSDVQDYKPLSRREIKRVLVAIGYDNNAVAGEKAVGGASGLRLTREQFGAMIDQAADFALRHCKVSKSTLNALAEIQTNLTGVEGYGAERRDHFLLNPDVGFADLSKLMSIARDLGYEDLADRLGSAIDRTDIEDDWRRYREGAADALADIISHLRQNDGLTDKDRRDLDGLARTITRKDDGRVIGYNDFLNARRGVKTILTRHNVNEQDRQRFANVRAYIESNLYFGNENATVLRQFEDRLRTSGAVILDAINTIRGAALNADESLAVEERVKQLKHSYETGDDSNSITTMLVNGLDTRSVALKLIADVRSVAFSAPEDLSRKASSYSSHRVHTASKAVCDRLTALRSAEEANKVGDLRLDEAIQIGGDVKSKGDGNRTPENDLLADLILNEDPIEVENGQLKGGERIGRLLYGHASEFLKVCVGLVQNGRLPTKWEAFFSPEQKQALRKLFLDVFKTAGIVTSDRGVMRVTCANVKEFRLKIYAHSQAIFKKISKAGVEGIIDAAVSAKGRDTLRDALVRIGLSANEADDTPRERLLRVLATRTFTAKNRAVQRGVFAQGFRFSGLNVDRDFDSVAALLGGGPLLHKLLQGIDTKRADPAAKQFLSLIRNKMPSIPERVVKAELLAVVAASQRGGASAIKAIKVYGMLGAASIGQVFKCTLTVDNGNGGTVDRVCVVKMKRPNANRMFNGEVAELRRAVEELKQSGDEGAGELESVFTEAAQSIKKELSLRDELRNVIRGVRAYGAQGGDVASMMPLLKTDGAAAKTAFVNAVNAPGRFDTRRVDQIIAEHCVGESESCIVFDFVDGMTLAEYVQGQIKQHSDMEQAAPISRKVDECVEALDCNENAKKVILGNILKKEAVNANDQEKEVVANVGGGQPGVQVGNNSQPDEPKLTGKYKERFEKLKTMDSNGRTLELGKISVEISEVRERIEKIQFSQMKLLVKRTFLEQIVKSIKNNEFVLEVHPKTGTLLLGKGNWGKYTAWYHTTIGRLRNLIKKACADVNLMIFHEGEAHENEVDIPFMAAFKRVYGEGGVEELISDISDYLEECNFRAENRNKVAEKLSELAEPLGNAATTDVRERIKPRVQELERLEELHKAVSVYQTIQADANEKKSVSGVGTDFGDPKKVADEHIKQIGDIIESVKNPPNNNHGNGVNLQQSLSGELEDIRTSYRGLLAMVEKITTGIVDGHPPFLHGDMHAGNIMRELNTGILKLIDYGRGMELSEDEAAAFTQLLEVFSAQERPNRAEEIVSAYMNIVEVRYQELRTRINNQPLLADENDLAEAQLQRETLKLLYTDANRRALVDKLANQLEGVGGDIVSGLEKLVGVIANQGLTLPQSLSEFVDSFVKIRNTERELRQVAATSVSAEKQLRKQVAVKYMNSLAYQISHTEGPVISERTGEKVCLFNGATFRDLTVYDLTAENINRNIEGLVQQRNELNVKLTAQKGELERERQANENANPPAVNQEHDNSIEDYGDNDNDVNRAGFYDNLDFQKDFDPEQLGKTEAEGGVHRDEQVQVVNLKESRIAQTEMEIQMLDTYIKVYEKVRDGLAKVEAGESDPSGLFKTDAEIMDSMNFTYSVGNRSSSNSSEVINHVVMERVINQANVPQENVQQDVIINV